MEHQTSPRDTPRSVGYASPRDDRFYTPRSIARGNSSNSDEWGQTPRFETPRYGEYNTPRGTNGSQSDGEGQFATPRELSSAYPSHPEHKRSNSMNSARSNGSQNLLAETYYRQQRETNNLAHHAQYLHSARNSDSNPNTARSTGSWEQPSPRAHAYSVDGYYNNNDSGMLSAAQAKYPPPSYGGGGSPREHKGGSGHGRLPPSSSSSSKAQYKQSQPQAKQQQPLSSRSSNGGGNISDDVSIDVLTDEMAAMGMTEQDVEDIFSFARHGRCEEIEKLLSRGIPVDVRDSYGNTILTIACQNGNKRVAKAVLRRGANINARNHKGNTPLHYCYHYGYGDTLGQYIIEKGADPNARNNVGRWTYEGI